MTPERFLEIMEKHAATVTLDLLLELAAASGFRVRVKLVDEKEPK
jgi:hypothetical protein